MVWGMNLKTSTSKSTKKIANEYASKKGRNRGNHQLRLVGYQLSHYLQGFLAPSQVVTGQADFWTSNTISKAKVPLSSTIQK